MVKQIELDTDLPLGPAEARDEIGKILSDALLDIKHPYTNARSPIHKATVERMTQLQKIAKRRPRKPKTPKRPTVLSGGLE